MANYKCIYTYVATIHFILVHMLKRLKNRYLLQDA